MHPGLSIDVARRFAQELERRLGDELIQVALFGSRARGDAHLRSDFDLMVVLREANGEARDTVHRAATELELELDHRVELSTKIVDLERFRNLRRSFQPFWRRYEKDERILWPETSSPSA